MQRGARRVLATSASGNVLPPPSSGSGKPTAGRRAGAPARAAAAPAAVKGRATRSRRAAVPAAEEGSEEEAEAISDAGELEEGLEGLAL